MFTVVTSSLQRVDLEILPGLSSWRQEVFIRWERLTLSPLRSGCTSPARAFHSPTVSPFRASAASVAEMVAPEVSHHFRAVEPTGPAHGPRRRG